MNHSFSDLPKPGRYPDRLSYRLITYAAIAYVFSLPGCNGPAYDVAPVTGVVTLNGEPVPQAQVTFLPEQGRPATDITDEDGRYELSYTINVDGAPPGKYRVRISTAVEQPDESMAIERIPAKYNAQSELEAEVLAKENVINFELTN